MVGAKHFTGRWRAKLPSVRSITSRLRPDPRRAFLYLDDYFSRVYLTGGFFQLSIRRNRQTMMGIAPLVRLPPLRVLALRKQVDLQVEMRALLRCWLMNKPTKYGFQRHYTS